ncbi:MAG: L-fucose:H+ symporter permease [Melioribacteraceae bacterium]|nr:L-fucose:H+ symporter permease [Melioribacteraceae bacterium]MCF8356656.1 L-fucose:H+ symporter permease [Melioribacteraceae bacterium]MCF8393880.1 L-fucose:H+ symporter permease [Melioribacteraceae bacterium]MCF8419652.1 L-fucose:H+ symporter permease [Melioribacteraceae bacterium]
MATAPSVSSNAVSAGPKRNFTPALTVLTSLFFMWGFLTALNDILIPHLKAVFALNYTEAMLIQFVFFIAYFVVSIPSGWIVEKLGYKKGIVVGLLVAGIGCLLFYPAATVRWYPLFLTAFFVLAAGITLLQVAANPYVAILGKPSTASSRLNLTQAFNSLGTTIAPYLGSLLILSVAVKTSEEIALLDKTALTAYQLAEAAAVQTPYLGLAAALILLSAIFAFLKLPQLKAADIQEETGSENFDKVYDSAWKYKHLVLGAVGIFVYVGAEVAIGSFLVNYLSESYIANFTEAEAGKFVSFYWGGAMVGRFIGSAVLRKLKSGHVLAFNAIAAAILVLTTMLTSGDIAMWSVLLIGLFNSIMFPTIFTLGVYGLGDHTGQGSGILIMAIVGGALIPVAQGVLADSIGIQQAFILPFLCYLYIAYYGMKGSVPNYSEAK